MTSTATRRINADLLNDPFFIGFDNLFNKVSKPTIQSNYPPYNIIKTKENWYELQLAIAGFKIEDLDIEFKDGVLTIRGNKTDTTQEYIHKGISTRSFERSFTLVNTILVRAANLADGILTIQLENIIPEEKKPHKIVIGSSGTLAHAVLNG
jgi:molecular chaperone IbpA